MQNLNSVGLGTLQIPRNSDHSSNYENLKAYLLTIGQEAQQQGKVIILDCARAYGNEEHIGKFFHEFEELRSMFLVVTKIGIKFDKETKF